MYSVLAFLRTIICTGVAFVVWYILKEAIGSPGSIVGTLVPVWMAGMIGGVISSIFNPRQGVMLAFTCGVLLAIGFLWVNHGVGNQPMLGGGALTLWPLWFPAAFYLGAYGHLLVLARR